MITKKTSSESSADKNILKTKDVKTSLAIQIPMTAFILAITIVICVSSLFYIDSKNKLLQQQSETLSLKGKLVVPLIEQLYSQTEADVLFLSSSSAIAALVKASGNNNPDDIDASTKRLERIFSRFLEYKSNYYQIRFIGVKNDGLELVNVKNHLGDNEIIPTSRLQHKSNNDYFVNTIKINDQAVYFSKISLNKENGKVEVPHKPVIRVGTPVFNPATGDVFGIVVINLNFSSFIGRVENELTGYDLYLANNEGDYLVHPNKDKMFGFDLGKRHLMQMEFPSLASAMNNSTNYSNYQKFMDIETDDFTVSGYYSYLSDDIHQGIGHGLRSFVVIDNAARNRGLLDLKIKNTLLGITLLMGALGLAIVAGRRIAIPLSDMIDTLKNYEKTGDLSKLPTQSVNEIGVVARNFKHLFLTINETLETQTQFAQEAELAVNKLNAVFEQVADAFITIDPEGAILSFNKAAENIFLYPSADIIDKHIKLLIPTEYSKKHDQYLELYAKTGENHLIGSSGADVVGVKSTGERFPIHVSVSEVVSDDGNTYIGIVRDISKEKAMEYERNQHAKLLQLANEKTGIATNAAGVGIWEFDLISGVLSWDDLMLELYEVHKSSFTQEYSDWELMVHPDDIDIVSSAAQHSIEHITPYLEDFRIITPSGRIKHLRGAADIRCDDEGNPIMMIGVNYDITEIKESEIAQREAKELAEETARHKAEFLASMSHEIRTPMNGVLGMLGLLMRSELSEEQRHRAKLATSSAESLLTLINDILDFSKVEAGKLDLEIVDFDLRGLLGEFSETMAYRVQEKGLEIILDVSKVDHSHVMGDPGRLRQILTNIVGNAIKFTHYGEIVIRADIQQGTDDKLTFSCVISDTGIGIPENKIDTLFDSFTQVDASTTREYGGTGLGLAICKKLCKLMGGDVTATSIAGEGSQFTFHLDLIESQQSTRVIPTVDINGVHLLIVDDNKTNRVVLREQLEIWGAKVTEAESAHVALEILSDESRPTFKVAFLDMQMPHMDGAELSKRIKENARLAKLKLVMMTSMATRGDAQYFANLGFSGYFPKPTTTSDLLDTLALTLNEDVHGEEPIITHNYLQKLQHAKNPIPCYDQEEAAEIKRFKACRLLLVEDNRINQEVAKHILAELGFEINVDVAGDGLEALQSLNIAKHDTPYDVVLMDCQMPEMDGYQATQAIRIGQGGDVHTDVAIIAMTANAMKGDKEKCLAIGMSDYLSKPIDPGSLKEKLLEWLPEKESIVVNVEPKVSLANINDAVDTTKNTNVTDGSHKTIPANVVWDEKVLLKRLNNNQIIMHKLIHLFLEETPKQIEEFSDAYASNDVEEMISHLHKIKGVCGNIGAMTLYEQSGTLEEKIKNSHIEQSLYDSYLHNYQQLSEHLFLAVS